MPRIAPLHLTANVSVSSLIQLTSLDVRATISDRKTEELGEPKTKTGKSRWRGQRTKLDSDFSSH